MINFVLNVQSHYSIYYTLKQMIHLNRAMSVFVHSFDYWVSNHPNTAIYT